MQQLNDFLKNANYQPAFNVGIALAGLVACGIVVILLLHTLHLMGQRTPLYGKQKPVEGWNKRFYPAGGFMVIFLLILMWLLNVWSHKISTAQ
jgi:hypothetical protein